MIQKYSVFILCLLFLNSAFAADAVGMFMSAKGDVKVTSDGTTVPAKIGMAYHVGDLVATGDDGRAKITMKDRNNIFVSPNTTYSLTIYETGAKKNVEINLKEGKVRNEVNNKYDGTKNKFLIKTPTAVAGVRGTDFVTSFDTQTKVTEVVTIKGAVALNTIGGMGNVVVPAGHMSSVRSGEAPLPPQPAPPEKMVEVKKDFNVSTKSPGAEKQANSSATSDANKDGRAPASSDSSANSGATGSGARVVDKQDQSPETFDHTAPATDTAKNPGLPGSTAGPGSATNNPAAPTSPNPSNLLNPIGSNPTTTPVDGVKTNLPKAVRVPIKVN